MYVPTHALTNKDIYRVRYLQQLLLKKGILTETGFIEWTHFVLGQPAMLKFRIWLRKKFTEGWVSSRVSFVHRSLCLSPACLWNKFLGLWLVEIGKLFPRGGHWGRWARWGQHKYCSRNCWNCYGPYFLTSFAGKGGIRWLRGGEVPLLEYQQSC